MSLPPETNQPTPSPVTPAPAPLDVFISYARANQEWVRVLAENLHQSKLNVFYDEWMIDPGDVLVHELDEGIRNSRNGVLVVSRAAFERPWVQEEYAAMMTRAVAGKQRLIPVLIEDAELPPLLASRVWVDFRGADGPVYQARLQELVRALTASPGPPPRTGELKPPPGTGFQPQGTLQRCLRIARDKVALLGGPEGVEGIPRGLNAALEQRLWELGHARRSMQNALSYPVRGAGGQTLDSLLATVGLELGEAFLPAAVAQALETVLAQAARMNNGLELGIEVADEKWLDLPWETLCLPSSGAPLALHSHVSLYRRLPVAGMAPAVSIPGPLRILVVVGSPEAQNERGELLDMERELGRILDAVETARREGKAWVRILETGGVQAIREALEEERYHVLYISCHAAPGQLILENEEGQEDRVTAERLWKEGLPAGRGVPLVVLAGCSTGLQELAEQEAGALPSVARDLVEHGVPAVIAMQGPVGDRYATELGALVFAALATWEAPLSLRALAEARRQLERERQQDRSPQCPPPEWAIPTLYTARQVLPLYDPQAPFESLVQAPEPVLDRGVIVRRVGDFVGRRREQRLARRALHTAERAGVLIHGMGGVGKSTLAAQLMHRLAREGWMLVSVSGEVDNDNVLEAVGNRLFAWCLERQKPENNPLRELSRLLKEPKMDWEERLGLLFQQVLNRLPLALLLDNFEDNLDAQRQVKGELGALLASWLQQPGKSRLLLTCRYPFRLPDDLQDGLESLHLGPLSLAETRKLVLRLPGLGALPPEELQRAYEQVGGHPRALEYLDALLRGGKARFPDVERRLRKALKDKGIDNPGSWCAAAAGNLDQALAETVTLAADDALLNELLTRLADQPLAHQLLLGASVYRAPVDETGLIWQVGEPMEPAESSQPPMRAPAGFAEAVTMLETLSLLSPFQLTDEEAQRYTVHRWTAGALARRFSQVLTEAHRRAARYWDWRVRVLSHSLEEYLEARYHYYEAGEIEQAVAVTESVCSQLGIWGAWSREERLCREVLTWVPEGSPAASKFLHQLGNVSCLRGDYEAALGWYRQALEIAEALGNRAGMAGSYHQLGIVAQQYGDYEAALGWYRQALEIKESLGDRAGMANSYHGLGMVAQARGDYEAALGWYRQALEIAEALGNRAGMAHSYHGLGMVAQARGDYEAALGWYRQALEIAEALGNRAGMASSYGQLGNVSYLRGDYEAALGWYRQALEIAEALGNRAGMASSYHQLGMVAQERGDYEAALGWYRQALEIKESLGDRAGMVNSYHGLGMVAQARGDYEAALGWYRQSLEIAEALGNRAGMASSYSQIGVLLTETGKPEEAIPLNLRSLAIRLELGVPKIRIDLHWLTRQRDALGEQRFLAILREHLDENGVKAVLKLLDEQAAKQQDNQDPPPPRLSLLRRLIRWFSR